MYFWNIKALAQTLKEKKLSSYDKMKYYLIMTVAVTIVYEILSFVPTEISLITIADSILIVAITFIGIIICYKANQYGDKNEEFIDRMICLSLPITLRLIIICISIMILYMIIGYTFWGNEFDSFVEKTNIVDVIIEMGFELAYYIWIRSHILKIVRGEENL